jgi:hypothetical protein
VIVGMALLIGAAGLGTGVFIASKTGAENNGRTGTIVRTRVDQSVALLSGTAGILPENPENANPEGIPEIAMGGSDFFDKTDLRRIALSKCG